MSRSISKKKRFDVFARDEFTCQYCGRNPIDDNIVLEIDHCISVKNGGGNEKENLITSCFDCNRGKAGNSIILKQENKIEILEQEQKRLNERLEQVKYIKNMKDDIKNTKKEIENSKYLFVEEMLDGCFIEFINNIKTRIKTQHTKYGISLYILEECLEITHDKFCHDEFYVRDFIKYFYGVLRNKNG